jgi:hypothetical protein
MFWNHRAGLRLPVLLAVVAAAAFSAAPARAQAGGEREAEVLGVIEKLFQAMQARDTAAIRDVFDPTARLLRAPTRQSATAVQVSTVDQFVNSIANAPAASELIERIYSPEIRIDGNLATVWTFYTFHMGEQFSHCGIDAAQLFETSAGWKIVSLADTSRRENCTPPRS